MRKDYILYLLSLFFILNPVYAQTRDWYFPIAVEDRTAKEAIQLTGIGTFGHHRPARPNVRAHLHSGIDIERPGRNYRDEPVYPAAKGKVISLRDDGPFAQVIIEHDLNEQARVWTVYEHVAGITVSIADEVNPFVPIARFMTKEELDEFGWQFDHFHFEILKKAPRPLKPSEKTPYRFFGVYNLECYSQIDLDKYYYDPLEFICRDPE